MTNASVPSIRTTSSGPRRHALVPSLSTPSSSSKRRRSVTSVKQLASTVGGKYVASVTMASPQPSSSFIPDYSTSSSSTAVAVRGGAGLAAAAAAAAAAPDEEPSYSYASVLPSASLLHSEKDDWFIHTKIGGDTMNECGLTCVALYEINQDMCAFDRSDGGEEKTEKNEKVMKNGTILMAAGYEDGYVCVFSTDEEYKQPVLNTSALYVVTGATEGPVLEKLNDTSQEKEGEFFGEGNDYNDENSERFESSIMALEFLPNWSFVNDLDDAHSPARGGKGRSWCMKRGKKRRKEKGLGIAAITKSGHLVILDAASLLYHEDVEELMAGSPSSSSRRSIGTTGSAGNVSAGDSVTAVDEQTPLLVTQAESNLSSFSTSTYRSGSGGNRKRKHRKKRKKHKLNQPSFCYSTFVRTLRVRTILPLVDVDLHPDCWEKPTGAIASSSTCSSSRGGGRMYLAVGMSNGTMFVFHDGTDENHGEETTFSRRGDGGGDNVFSFGEEPCLAKQLRLPCGIMSLKFSDSGGKGGSVILLAAGLADGEVALLDATPTGTSFSPKPPPFQPFHFLESHHGDEDVPITSVSFVRQGDQAQLLMAVASGSVVRVMDGATFEVFYAHEAGAIVNSVEFVNDEVGGVGGRAKVLVARSDGIVELIDLQPWGLLFGGSEFLNLHARFQPFPTARFPRQPLSSSFAPSSSSFTVRRSNFGSLFQRHPVTSLSFSGDGHFLAVACGRDIVLCDSKSWLSMHPAPAERVGTRTSGTPVTIEKIGNVGSIRGITYSPDSTLLVVVSDSMAEQREENGGSVVSLQRVSSSTEMTSSALEMLGQISMETRVVTTAFSPDSKLLAIVTKDKCMIIDVAASSDLSVVLITLQGDGGGDDAGVFTCAAWSPDGFSLAIASKSKVKFYDSKDFSETSSLDLHCEIATTLAFNAPTSMVAVGSSDGTVTLACPNERGAWEITNKISHGGTLSLIAFSPDSDSPFLAILDSSLLCHIYSTQSFALVQEIESKSNGVLSSMSFDPSGTLLAIGGTSTRSDDNRGEVIVVRIGELLRVDWFPLCRSDVDGDDIKSEDICGKILSLNQFERAQILYHRPAGGDLSEDRASFPLARRLNSEIEKRREKNHRFLLGSSRMNASPPSEVLIAGLREIMSKFPRVVFANTTTFEVALEWDNPSVLKLVFSTALVGCRSHPYVLMNDMMRGGLLTSALTMACEVYPDVVSDVIHDMVLWPVPSFSSKEVWKVEIGQPVYSVASSPVAESIFDEQLKNMKGGTLARPVLFPIPGMSSTSFLSALAMECSAEVFDTLELGIILDELWENEIKWMFIVDFFLYVAFFVVWSILVTQTNVSASEEAFGGEYLKLDTATLSIIVFVFNLGFGYKELKQLHSTSNISEPEELLAVLRQHLENARSAMVETGVNFFVSPQKTAWDALMWALSQHLEDWWNICDFLTWWFVNLTLVLLIWRTDWTVECTVVTSFFVLLKTLSYLRGFESSGWLLTVLYKNYIDSQGFLMVIGTILLGFSVMFRILLGPFDEDYSSYTESLFSMFEIGIIGDFNRAQFKESQNPLLTMILFFFLLLVVFIVALNGYIAVLGDSFDDVKENGNATMRYQRALLIIDYMKLMGHRRREDVLENRKYFLALVEVDHEDVVAAEEDTRLMLSRKERLSLKREEARTIANSRNKRQVKEELASVRSSLKSLLERLHAQDASTVTA